ncbi:MAG TPA: hydroxyacid dehydrogenase [Candidatus Desulfobacillus sp.]|nr:hydroxyacid dehydrogenase [Candidatus Desulfobacillus sp.]
MKILISEFMDDAAVDALRGRFDVRYDPTLVDRRGELLAGLAAADALIVRNRTRVDEALLAAAPRLRVVGRLGVGLDNIDLPACRGRKVEVIPATGANALAVAEYVIAAMLVLLRGAFLSTGRMLAGEWPRTPLSEGRESAGKTLGLVGFGGIGRLTAKLAQGLGIRVLAHDPLLAESDPAWSETGVLQRDLDALLAEADAVSLHVPLTEGTRRLIDAKRLATMKPGAVLINTARGGIVDEAALARALRDGRLAGAALDVFEQEPLAAGSPLEGAPNLILTPHIGGVSREANARVSSLIADKVAAFLAA